MHVDKELYGETFRAAPRLTPLEARAIRLALEYVGPMIAAEAHTPLERVRKKLEETFGQFELVQTPEPHVGGEEESFVSIFSTAIRSRRLVEVEYQKEGEESSSTRVVEPYSLERELPNWRVHTWDRTRDGERSFRLDRMRAAKLLDETFERARGLRAEPSARRAHGARALHEGRRPLGDRARRASARRRNGGRRAAGRQRRVARERDLLLPRRRDRARARRPARHIRDRAKELAAELGVNRLVRDLADLGRRAATG